MRKIFMRGMIAVIPIALTIALLSWFFSFFEKLFGIPLKHLLGSYYHPGMGIVAALILIFILGVLLNNWLFRKLYLKTTSLLNKIPLIKTLYGSLTDLMNFFGSKGQGQGQVVLVEIQGLRVIGLVTQENLPVLFSPESHVAVFFPMSYQIGGFTALIPKERLTKVEMSFEQAMQFVVTAGAVKKKDED